MNRAYLTNPNRWNPEIEATRNRWNERYCGKPEQAEQSSVVIWIALFATLLIGGCFVAAAGGIVS